ncbi:MAG: hypothetical protein WB392_12965 [Methanotrichaceae archaeon]
MLISSWYNGGSLDAFCHFCNRNRRKTILVKLRDKSELIKGVLYKRYMEPYDDGLYILLNPKVNHPAYYSLDDIESIHEFKEEPDLRALVNTLIAD